MNEARETLMRKLGEFLEKCPGGHAQAQRTLEFVKEHPTCCSSALAVGHVTASAWVLDETGDRVVLTHHKFLDRWLQLGGHVDEGETVSNAALREAKEESGLDSVELVSDEILDVDVHPIPARSDQPAHYHYDVRFLCTADRAEPLIVSDESHDVAWIPLADLEQYNDSESILRMEERSRRKHWWSK